MSATRAKRNSEESVPQAPQSTPASLGMPGHDFTLQAVMELQKSVGELNANVLAMRSSLDGLKGKVDDLVGWKHKIIGGAAVLGLVFAALGYIIGKASDYVTLRSPMGTQAVPVPSAPTPSANPSSKQ